MDGDLRDVHWLSAKVLTIERQQLNQASIVRNIGRSAERKERKA